MLYILDGQQVIADIKGTPKAPVVITAYWAKDDQDLTIEELDRFMLECADEIMEAAYIYRNIRIAAGDRRD